MCYRSAMLDLSQGAHLSLVIVVMYIFVSQTPPLLQEVLKYIVDVLSYLKYNQVSY